MKKTFLFSALVAISMSFTACSSDDEGSADNTPPTISIQSPDLNQTYSTDFGNGLGPEIAILTAQGVDNVKLEIMTLTVTNSSGTVVFETTKNNNDPNNENTLTISDGFETTNAGTYNVVFTATDASGNSSASNPRTFTYED